MTRKNACPIPARDDSCNLFLAKKNVVDREPYMGDSFSALISLEKCMCFPFLKQIEKVKL